MAPRGPCKATTTRARRSSTTSRSSSPLIRLCASSNAVRMAAMRAADWPSGWVLEKLAYEVRDAALFGSALTHRSVSGSNNERLEFLGDAVLNLLIAEHLYRDFPSASEGDLSRLRSRLVSGESLAQV